MRKISGHIPYLDGWRGLAILCVFFGHFVSNAKYWWLGSFGVQLFFALSGYLMCNILFIKKEKLPNFFVSRIVRVLPTFLLFIAVLLVYSAFFQPEPFMPSGEEIVATVTFLRTYFPHELPLTSKQWPIGHLWSLNVEEHSYIFLALVALLTRRAKRTWLTGLCLVASTFAVWLINVRYLTQPPDGPNHFSMRTESASLGLLAAATIRYLRHHLPLRLEGVVPPWLPLVSVAVAFLCFSTYRFKGFHFTIAPILIACAINFLDQLPAFVKTCLSNKVLCWFGTCSFSLYLWQQPLHMLTIDHGANGWLMFATAIGIGAISFYAFENPVRKVLVSAWRNRSIDTKAQSIETQGIAIQDGSGAAVARIPEE